MNAAPPLSRRTLLALAGAGTLALAGGCASGAGPAPDGHGADLNALALEAALYIMAPLEFARQAHRNAQRGGPNVLTHRPGLSKAQDRNVTTPNNDTLYSAAMLDLAVAPVIVSAPASPGRYLSVGIHSAFTDVEALISARETAFGPVALTVCGPHWQGDAAPGTRLARLSTSDAWLIARVLVASPDDLPAARAQQQAITLTPFPGQEFSPSRSWLPEPTPEVDPANRLDVLNHLLSRSAPAGQALRAARFARLGIGDPAPGAFARLSPEIQAIWASATQAAEAAVRGGLAVRSRNVSDWRMPAPGIAEFGADDLYRAAISRGGLGALPAREAVYMSWRQEAVAGAPTAFTLTLPPDPPSDAFWSLSLYVPEPDGRRFFFPNPLERFAIGDRTPGLKREADGTVRILMASTPPADPSNWLPAPEGPFDLVLRLYLPRQAAQDGGWTPGPLTPL